MTTASTTEIVARCPRCEREAVIPAEQLRQRSLRADVSLAYLSRRVVCQHCGSRAARLERRPVARDRHRA